MSQLFGAFVFLAIVGTLLGVWCWLLEDTSIGKLFDNPKDEEEEPDAEL